MLNDKISIANSGVEVQISFGGVQSKELRDILALHLPAFLDLFIRKNSEYKENAQVLGPAGQFADMWRKMGKLKTALWDGEEERLVSEGVDEILQDLIGHCFLTLQMRKPDIALAEGDPVEMQFSRVMRSNFEAEVLEMLHSIAEANDGEFIRMDKQDLIDALQKQTG